MKKLIIGLVMLLTVVTLACLPAGQAGAAVPENISFQGRASGVTPGEVQMIFKLYDAATGDAPLWTENQTAAVDASGIFNVLLGSVNPFSSSNLSFDSQYYLETTVNGTVLSPPHPLTAAPYALTAKSLPGVTVSNGNVGIGTTEPGGKLHVDMDGAGTTWEGVFKDGNVGIGTTEPTAKLDVWGDYVAIRADESRHKAFVMEDISTNKRWYLSHRNITGENKFMLIYTPDNGMTWQFPLTVLTNNNVGIGTLTPSRRLSVAGTIEITSGSGGQLKFADGSLQTTAAGAGAASWAVSGN